MCGALPPTLRRFKGLEAPRLRGFEGMVLCCKIDFVAELMLLCCFLCYVALLPSLVCFGCQIAALRHLWQPCLPKRSYLAPNSDQLGTFGQPCWPKGGPRGAMLSPSCSMWVPSWSTFGAKGLLFDTFGSHVGHKASQGHIGRRQNSDFGDCCVKTKGPSKTHV